MTKDQTKTLADAKVKPAKPVKPRLAPPCPICGYVGKPRKICTCGTRRA